VTLCVSLWFGFLFMITIWFLVTLVLLFLAPMLGSLSVVVIALSLVVPLDIPCPSVIRSFMKHSVNSFVKYLPIEVEYMDKDALGNPGPWVIAYEPHGVLPQGMCIFNHVDKPACLGFHPTLNGTAIMVSNSIFRVPIMRHLWWWLGCRPVSRPSIERLLAQGTSIALCPGGVHECLLMNHENESLYLKNRRGFIHLAIKNGANIVPVFGFGQSDLYKYWRPLYDWPASSWTRKVFARLSRAIAFVPMVAWGSMGPVPYREQLTIYIGKPIRVEKVPDIAIHDERVQIYLDEYIHELRSVYNAGRHKFGKGKPLVVF